MKNITILGVTAILLVAFGYFTLFSSPANETASEAEAVQEELSKEATPTAAKAEARQGEGSLEFLRQLGENMECTISYTDEEQQAAVEGTYFVSGGDMRGDFLTPSPDLSEQVLSSVIIDGSMMYLWSEIEGEMYGIKMDLSGSEEVDANEPVPLDAAVQYDCKPWVAVDRTVFEPPSDVLFRDMSELMNAGPEYGTIYQEGGEVPN